jgi:hypothetical protein
MTLSFLSKLESFLQKENYNLSVTKDSGAKYYLDNNNNMVLLDVHKYYYFNASGMILQDGYYTDDIEQFIRDYRLNSLLDGK